MIHLPFQSLIRQIYLLRILYEEATVERRKPFYKNLKSSQFLSAFFLGNIGLGAEWHQQRLIIAHLAVKRISS